MFSTLRGRLLRHESLASYTSWRVGGAADFVFFPADLLDLETFLKELPSEVPVSFLGLGSNTLVRDGGVRGAVIITQGSLTGLSVTESLPFIVRAEAGIACAQLARFSARLSLQGIEFMAGIPGTVGGALAMNAGCYGGETWQFISQVETINRQGERQIQPATSFEFAYRHVKRAANEWFTAGYFQLFPGEKKASLEKIRTLLEKRNLSQPTNMPNCGSVFRNPPQHYAARLIEQCGLKGFKKGGASVSEKHANFIINEGDAKAEDIESLVEEIKVIVEDKCAICLIPEVCIIGEKG